MERKPTSVWGPHAIDRRRLLTGAAACGGAILASALGPAALAQETPKKGGRFRIGHAGASTTNTLDPALIDDEYMTGVGYAIRNNLTEIDSTGALVGELAESWEPSSDATQWRFTLRRGVEFHDGKTLDADDVKATLNHHRGPDSKSPAKPIVDPIVDIQSDGPRVVVISLKEGNADFPFLLSAPHLNIMKATDLGADWQSGIGTGGYILRRFDPGVSVEFARNSNYWKDGRAHFDEVEIVAVNDPTARINALVAGELDAINRCDLKTLDQLARVPGIEIDETTGFEHLTAPMLTDVSPFDDNNVRLAAKHAVDRDVLLKVVLNGHGVVGNDHPIMPRHRYFSADIPQHSYDPDKARFYLKKAGHSKLAVQLSAADAAFVGALDAAQVMKENAAAAGLDVTIVREANDGYWSNVWIKKPWCMGRWGGRPTEDWIFTVGYSEDAPWNDTRWSNARFNDLLRAARTELDESKRRQMYGEMQRILHDDGGMINLLFGNWVYARSMKVRHGGDISPVWDMDGQRAIERWWFA
jgi:peptide/nickel transport system substrate-binding protein